MPIVIATCPDCGRPIEIDTDASVILTGNDEMIWRIIRRHHRRGDRINVQVIADMAFVNRGTVYNALNRLALLGLIKRSRIRRYYHYAVAPAVQMSKTTSKISTS
jgi:Fe2+ or Zn2+ uptake regulation protein